MMRYLDVEIPKIRSPKRVNIDLDAVSRMIYDDSSDCLNDNYADEE